MVYLQPIVLPTFLYLWCKYEPSEANNVNARTTLKFSPIWIFNFPALRLAIKIWQRSGGRGGECGKRRKARKPRPRRWKRGRRRMYRASGNTQRSYIFLQERLSDYAIALRYAITRIYWYIIPRGLGKRRDRCTAYTQIRNRYAVPLPCRVFPAIFHGKKLIREKVFDYSVKFPLPLECIIKYFDIKSLLI